MNSDFLRQSFLGKIKLQTRSFLILRIVVGLLPGYATNICEIVIASNSSERKYRRTSGGAPARHHQRQHGATAADEGPHLGKRESRRARDRYAATEVVQHRR